MWWLIFFLVLWLGLVAHELGHYFAFRRLKIPVHEVSLLGLPFGPALTLYTDANGTRWSIRPLVPLGAFVRPDSDVWEHKKDDPRISLKDLAWIAGSGPWASVTSALVGLLVIVLGRLVWIGMLPGSQVFLFLVILALVIGALFRWRREIALYIFPVIGGPMTVVLLASFVWIWYMDGLSGFALSEIGAKLAETKQQTAGTLMDAALLAIFFSASVGVLNLAWLGGLDGGHLIEVIIKRRVPNPRLWIWALDMTSFFTIVLVFIPLVAEVVRFFL